MASQTPKLLVEELLKQGVSTPKVIGDLGTEALSSDRDLGEILVEKQIITDLDLLNIKAKIYQLPVIEASGLEINKELSKEVSSEIINFYKILPF